MSDNNFELSRRKILGSLGVIGAASAGAGMGTTAFLNDEESFENNTLTAGELDLRIDWQQRYWGPMDDSAAAYGAAGRPWVNAHPDHDDDGIQSISDKDDDGDPETYQEGNDNIQEYLNCQTLENHTDEDFGDQDHLIELSDVKPGDRGEITFSFHLCDNPGYVWLLADNFSQSEGVDTEPENEVDDTPGGDLADNIVVKAWYDIDCDNTYEKGEGEDAIVRSTNLGTFVDELSNGELLDPSYYPGIEGGDSSSDGCPKLGKIEWNSGGLSLETDDNFGGQLLETRTDPLAYVFLLENLDTGVQAIIELSELHLDSTDSSVVQDESVDLNEIEEFDWRRLDQYTVDGTTYTSDDVGICDLGIKSSTTTEFDTIAAGCSLGENNVVSPSEKNGDLQGISFTEFYYCPPSGGSIDGFPGGETFCVGFEWMVPSDVGNEIQGDTVSFDLGFYTEQARHNDDPGQTIN